MSSGSRVIQDIIDRKIADPSAAAGYNVSQGREAAMSKPMELPAPRRFEPGTILTLRMRGHSRSPVAGQDYFAPAVVLEQFMPQGEISVLIWDSSAGTHYNASYAIRELGARGAGAEREMYVLADNIGEVLFSPARFARLCELVDAFDEQFFVANNKSSRNTEDIALVSNELGKQGRVFDARLAALEAFMTEFKLEPVQAVVAGRDGVALPEAAVGATKDERTNRPKVDK